MHNQLHHLSSCAACSYDALLATSHTQPTTRLHNFGCPFFHSSIVQVSTAQLLGQHQVDVVCCRSGRLQCRSMPGMKYYSSAHISISSRLAGSTDCSSLHTLITRRLQCAHHPTSSTGYRKDRICGMHTGTEGIRALARCSNNTLIIMPACGKLQLQLSYKARPCHPMVLLAR